VYDYGYDYDNDNRCADNNEGEEAGHHEKCEGTFEHPTSQFELENGFPLYTGDGLTLVALSAWEGGRNQEIRETRLLGL